MLEEDSGRRESSAEELLRRALLDEASAVAVSLKVGGLPVSDSVTVIFHGRRDLGTLQTYVAPGSRAAGTTVAASEMLRVPCDLDLADADDRAEAERLYIEQATAFRDALVGADVVLGVWREPLGELLGSDGQRRPFGRAVGPSSRPPAAPDGAGCARVASGGDARVQRADARRGQAADGNRVRPAGRDPRLSPGRRSRALRRGLPRGRRRACARPRAAARSPGGVGGAVPRAQRVARAGAVALSYLPCAACTSSGSSSRFCCSC